MSEARLPPWATIDCTYLVYGETAMPEPAILITGQVGQIFESFSKKSKKLIAIGKLSL